MLTAPRRLSFAHHIDLWDHIGVTHLGSSSIVRKREVSDVIEACHNIRLLLLLRCLTVREIESIPKVDLEVSRVLLLVGRARNLSHSSSSIATSQIE